MLLSIWKKRTGRTHYGYSVAFSMRNTFESLNNIRTFLFVTCRNACIDYLRFLQKQRTVHKEIQYLEEMEVDEKNEIINA